MQWQTICAFIRMLTLSVNVYLNWCLFIVNNKGKACIVVDCIGHKAVGMAWNIPLVAMASDQR